MSPRLPASFSRLAGRLRRFARKLGQTAHLAVGVPDYDGYVAHRRAHHPEQPVMTYEQFFRERMDSRYKKGSSRCC